MAGILTDLLGAGAGFGKGFLDERRRKEEMMAEARKQQLEERRINAAIANQETELGYRGTELGYKGDENKREQGEFGANFGNDIVPGGLKKYDIDMPGNREEAERQFLMDNPEFVTGNRRMTPRDKSPYVGRGGSSGDVRPMDIANFRLNYIKGVMGGDQGIIPPKFETRAARFDSLAGAQGLKPLLQGELAPPTATTGNVKTKPVKAKPSVADSLKGAKSRVPSPGKDKERRILGAIQSSTDDPAVLLKELNEDYKANPKAFQGVDMAKVRAAIRAKSTTRKPK